MNWSSPWNSRRYGYATTRWEYIARALRQIGSRLWLTDLGAFSPKWPAKAGFLALCLFIAVIPAYCPFPLSTEPDLESALDRIPVRNSELDLSRLENEEFERLRQLARTTDALTDLSVLLPPAPTLPRVHWNGWFGAPSPHCRSHLSNALEQIRSGGDFILGRDLEACLAVPGDCVAANYLKAFWLYRAGQFGEAYSVLGAFIAERQQELNENDKRAVVALVHLRHLAALAALRSDRFALAVEHSKLAIGLAKKLPQVAADDFPRHQDRVQANGQAAHQLLNSQDDALSTVALYDTLVISYYRDPNYVAPTSKGRAGELRRSSETAPHDLWARVLRQMVAWPDRPLAAEALTPDHLKLPEHLVWAVSNLQRVRVRNTMNRLPVRHLLLEAFILKALSEKKFAAQGDLAVGMKEEASRALGLVWPTFLASLSEGQPAEEGLGIALLGLSEAADLHTKQALTENFTRFLDLLDPQIPNCRVIRTAASLRIRLIRGGDAAADSRQDILRILNRDWTVIEDGYLSSVEASLRTWLRDDWARQLLVSCLPSLLHASRMALDEGRDLESEFLVGAARRLGGEAGRWRSGIILDDARQAGLRQRWSYRRCASQLASALWIDLFLLRLGIGLGAAALAWTLYCRHCRRRLVLRSVYQLNRQGAHP